MKPITAAFVAAAVLMAACSTTLARVPGKLPPQSYADYAGAPIKEFRSFTLNGYEAVSKSELVIWTGPSQAYLLKVWDNCRDLEWAEGLSVSSTMHSISHFEHVTVGRDRCPITEIRPLDIKKMRADRAAARAALDAAAPVAAPAPAKP